MRARAVVVGLALGLLGGLAEAQVREQRVAATAGDELAAWTLRLDGMLDAAQARLAWSRDDSLIPGRRHERFTQLHRGVPVYGGQLVRQTNGRETLSVFGTLYEGIELDVTPALSPEASVKVVRDRGYRPFGREGRPELVVLPRDEGGYALVYRIRAMRRFQAQLFFVDARSGAVVKEWNDTKTQSAVGNAVGVLGDRKKISAKSAGGRFLADDELRPPRLATYDFHGDFEHLNEVPDFFDADLAFDSDNNWTDGANVDAHVYSGYTYDFYFKRFGRHGLDNADLHLRNVTHPVSRDDIFIYDNDVIGLFFLNAFYGGDGVMVYGEGLPEGFVDTSGRYWDYLAGGLDVVAHELTHGVTDYTSNLIYQNESGALNEAFSDMMAIAVEFYFQPQQGDYLLGEDVITPGGLRSLQSPIGYGDPDHYSIRFRGSQDNGGVHTNSAIPSHAYYLAIEGGTNRVSGLRVTGVGAINREQIERVFYRAFTEMLPASANFATARAATIQSARDLYGAGSTAETAVIQAWTAVGVN